MARSKGTTTLKFLVVDDDEDVRDVLCQMVSRLGHVAATASDGLEALAALRQERFDVMILDISMPRMSGMGVARWLHDHPDIAPGMWTIVLSAWTGESRPVLHDWGVDTVVQKPIHLQQLRDLIASGPTRPPPPEPPMRRVLRLALQR